MHLLTVITMCVAMAFCGALMVNRSLKPNIKETLILAPVAVSATQANTTLFIDTQGCNSAMLTFTCGAITGAAVIVPGVVDSPDGTTWTVVDPTLLDWGGTVGPNNANPYTAGFTAGVAIRVGYLGQNRYVGASLTLVSGTSAIIGIVGYKSDLTILPSA